MTAQLSAHGDSELVALHERVARARRSVVGIRAGAHCASGWIALANGVVVTSRRGIGYPAEVSLTLEEGRVLPGRVFAVDVARDISLVLPLEVPGVAALPIRSPGEPRLGERVAVLSLPQGQGLRLLVARVCQVVKKGDNALPTFEIDALAPLGAPVLDAEGRAIGMVAACAGPGGEPAGQGQSGYSLVLTASSLQMLLAAADRPAVELRDRSPVYRCPACDDSFDVEHDRCLACGRLLPHAFVTPLSRVGAERLIRQGLSALGHVANRVRVGPSSWRIAQRASPTAEVATQVDIELDESGRTLTLRAPVVGLPAANHEPFYRFLLTMNDQTTGEFRVSVAGDEVSVSYMAFLDGYAERDMAMLVEEIVQTADEYRRTLSDTFDAVPRFESARSG